MSHNVVAPSGSVSVPLATGRIQIERWPTERPLLVVAVLVSILVWIVAVVSVIGLVYAAMLGLFFFVVHLTFVAHVRGSGVRLGPEQFPELYARVETLASRMGLEPVPQTYLMQAGGSLNAFATRFLGSNIVVLFSDLLDACGDNEAARDMIIAHELGHVHAGHLRWHWFLLPSKLVPFLGSALVRQRADIDTGWMTLGEWLASHPPLVKRMLELDPSLRGRQDHLRAGTVRALGILGLVALPIVVASWVGMSNLPAWMEAIDRQASGTGGLTGPAAEQAAAEAQARFEALAAFLDGEQTAGRPLPESADELYDRWQAAHPGRAAPLDPFDGDNFGYIRELKGYALWSSGPDQQPGTLDDVVFRP
jgi:Zn-dependent protease with chaperone function